MPNRQGGAPAFNGRELVQLVAFGRRSLCDDHIRAQTTSRLGSLGPVLTKAVAASSLRSPVQRGVHRAAQAAGCALPERGRHSRGVGQPLLIGPANSLMRRT